MGDRTGQALLAFGLGSAGALALWWLWRERRRTSDLAAFKRPVARVAKICIYPVKSGHRIELPTAHCGVRGLKYDRCWVIVDKNDRFMAQRQWPTLAQITSRLEIIDEDSTGGVAEGVVLHLTAPGMPELVVKEPQPTVPTTTIYMWNMSGQAVDVGQEAASWLEQFLGQEGCRMYYMAPHHKARTLLDDERWTDMCKPGDETSFADLSPVLMTSEASLELLNSHTESPIPMERFRANIIVNGCQAHEEVKAWKEVVCAADHWNEIKIGDSVILRSIKPCARCKETTVDQEKGVFTGPEPLKTLKMYRLYEAVYGKKDNRFGQSPMFGNNYGVTQTGTISVGDTVSCK